MSAEMRPGYKQTEVGVIPEDWHIKQVGEIATTVASGRSHVDSAFGDYPVYGSTGVIGRCRNGDYSGKAVLIARVGANAGKLAVVDGVYGVTDNTIIVRLDGRYPTLPIPSSKRCWPATSFSGGSDPFP